METSLCNHFWFLLSAQPHGILGTSSINTNKKKYGSELHLQNWHHHFFLLCYKTVIIAQSRWEGEHSAHRWFINCHRETQPQCSKGSSTRLTLNNPLKKVISKF